MKDTKTDPGFNVERLATLTDGFSGSDLKELCRNAAMVPVREFISVSADNHEALSKGQLEVSLGPSDLPTSLSYYLMHRDSTCVR